MVCAATSPLAPPSGIASACAEPAPTGLDHRATMWTSTWRAETRSEPAVVPAGRLDHEALEVPSKRHRCLDEEESER